MTVKIDKDGNLVITAPIAKPAPLSSTGKSKLLVSTRGNMVTDLIIDGKPVTIGLNVTIPAN